MSPCALVTSDYEFVPGRLSSVARRAGRHGLVRAVSRAIDKLLGTQRRGPPLSHPPDLDGVVAGPPGTTVVKLAVSLVYWLLPGRGEISFI